MKPASEADPLDLADPDAGQRKRIENVIDDVRGRLGHDAIARGRGLGDGSPGKIRGSRSS